jgi:hypothetical protein
MAKNKGFSIRIFLPEGAPDGLRIIEKSNWSGRGVVCPRPLLPTAKGRPEFGKAGAYVLIGPSEGSDVPRVYIGEGDPVRPRLEQHFAKKDFWTSAVFFTSKDDNLNKAHVQYLEARLVQLAGEAKRSESDNANTPDRPSLSEADTADVEGFLDEMLLCFPVLGVTVFERPQAITPSDRLLYVTAKGIHGRGYESPQGFTVLAGSQAVAHEVTSIHGFLSDLRRSLLTRGILQPDGEGLVLTQDYTFNSPSTASGVLLGRSSNGRTEWKNAEGVSLKELQAGKGTKTL